MSPEPHLGIADPARCGCDRDATGSLMPVDEALARGLALVRPHAATERVALRDATGRVLAEPARARLPLPPFDASAMDGYALRLSDLAGDGPWNLPVPGCARAGDRPLALLPGVALQIMTGAALPIGADAVIPQEQVTAEGGVLRVRQRPKPGAHIRPAGCDLAEGAEILSGGRVIGPREAGALAATGQGQIVVRRRIEVALLTTGSELTDPGMPLAPGAIWNANRFTLTAQLSAPWMRLHDFAAVPDDPAWLRRVLDVAASQADLVVTTGGVSIGDEDHLPRLVREIGGTIHVASVAMKPGKPLTIGRIGDAIWIGLPGNPVAAFVGWTVIGARIAEAMAGLQAAGPRKQVVRLAAPAAHHPGRCEFRLARLMGYDAHGVQVVELLSGQAAHRIALLPQANGLALIPAEAEAVPAGMLVEFLPL